MTMEKGKGEQGKDLNKSYHEKVGSVFQRERTLRDCKRILKGAKNDCNAILKEAINDCNDIFQKALNEIDDRLAENEEDMKSIPELYKNRHKRK